MMLTISCLVLAVTTFSIGSSSPDMQIYPGLRLSYVDDIGIRGKYRLKRYDNYLNGGKFQYPFQQDHHRDEYGDLQPPDLDHFKAIPERIKQLRQIIHWEKAQLNEFPNNPIYTFDLERARYRESRPTMQQRREQIQGLDEARMYPQEDEFRFEESGPYEDDFQESSDRYGEGDEGPSHHHMEHDDILTEEETFPSGRLKDVKIAEDPTEFAYAPPNPMFYKKVDAPTTEEARTERKIIKPAAMRYETEQQPLTVIQRSGLKSQNENRGNTLADIEDDIANRLNSYEVVAVKPEVSEVDSAGVYIIAVVAGISAAATVGLIAVGIGWYNLQKNAKNGCEGDYPAYGITGPNKDLSPSGDRRLAQSAQMYHYQHQKQQIISMERVQPGGRQGSVSEAESDEENEEGDYTVYECPGLAPTGEMEVKNPLFLDDPTPAQTPATKSNVSEEKK